MDRLLAGLQIKMGSVAKELPVSKRRAQWKGFEWLQTSVAS